MRLGEHRELRPAPGLVSVPDFTTLYRCLQRLGDQTIDRAVGETVGQLRGTRRKGRRRARVAVDATGLELLGAVSTVFVRRICQHGQKPLPWQHWLKWVVLVDLDQQFVLPQLARRGPWNDCANLPEVVEAASEQTRIGLVLEIWLAAASPLLVREKHCFGMRHGHKSYKGENCRCSV